MTKRKLLLVGISALGLVACAQKPSYPNPEPLPPPNLLQGGAMTAGRVTVRVIVQFKQSGAFSDEAFLKTLEQQVRAPVGYVTAVSGDTHVYGVQLPADEAPAAALQRLGTLPSVQRVELDDKVH